jgi:hypothetical protein
MTRTCAALMAVVGGTLVVATPAAATIVEVGHADPMAKPSCPSKPCLAIPRTTGYQAKVGTKRDVAVIPQDGRIVAWTISLSKPGKRQIAYFEKMLRGPAMAQITILRPRRKLRSRVMGQGEMQQLEPFFGTTVQFALRRTLRVKKGWIVALTVPTWAPALAAGLGDDTSWRASREKGTCDLPPESRQTAQTKVNQLAQYYCLYQGARLTYSATLVTDPEPAPIAKPPASPAPPPPPPPPPAPQPKPERRGQR